MDKNTKRLLMTGAYLWTFFWVGIIGLVCSIICIATAGKDKDMRYHGIQGLAYGITISVVAWILVAIFGGPFGYWGVGFYLGPFWIINILVLVYSIWLASKVYKGKKVQIPIVYSIVKGIIK